MKTQRETYLDFVNNFITVEGMADHYGLEPESLREEIEQGRLRSLSREDFDTEVIQLIKQRCECSQGDAQGIMEAHEWEVLTSWQRDQTPNECIKRIFG